jgi:hypothetical protein
MGLIGFVLVYTNINKKEKETPCEGGKMGLKE